MAGMIPAFAGDGGEPRLSEHHEGRGHTVAIAPKDRRLHDPHVSLEEYMYYAERTRAEEALDASAAPRLTLTDVLLPSKHGGAKTAPRVTESSNGNTTSGSGASEKPIQSGPGIGDVVLHDTNNINLNAQEKRAAISDEEWRNASRALRSATAAACFYLITTDILGPFGVGFSFGTMGWGEGIGLFTLFGICAGMLVARDSNPFSRSHLSCPAPDTLLIVFLR
jgi:hypothetical protein